MITAWRVVRLPAALVVAALAIGSGLVALAGASPIEAFGRMLDTALGGRYEVAETLVRATPVAIVALGALPALRAGVVTVGSEGSLAIGALVSTATLLAVRDAPSWVLVPLGALAGAVGGALWALAPAIARVARGVNEILATLLFNYVAASLLLWSLRTWLATPEPVATPRSETLPDHALIPRLVDGTRLHAGALLVLVAVVVLAWWVRTAGGLRVDVFGARPALGRRLGADPTRTVGGTMLLAGAAAGLAGWMQVAGVQGTLYPSVAGGLGFTGLLVALLGDLRPVTVVVAALVYAVLVTGADGMQAGTGVPSSIATVLQALLLVAAALAFAARRRRLDRVSS